MRFPCEIATFNRTKKGGKLTLVIAEEDADKVMQHVSQFMKRPVTMEVLVDAERVMQDIDKITEDQRKKAYALMKDFANEYGDTPENVKQMFKVLYNETIGGEISLSDCTRQEANDFIELILGQARELGYSFGFTEQTEGDSISRALLAQKLCFVCQQPGDVYSHRDGKLCLCKKHLAEAKHTNIIEKYHLELVK